MASVGLECHVSLQNYLTYLQNYADGKKKLKLNKSDYILEDTPVKYCSQTFDSIREVNMTLERSL